MKKVVLIVVTMVLLATVLVSCNKSVCPAYVIDNKVQVKTNG